MKYTFQLNVLATLFALSLPLASLSSNAADMAATQVTAAHERVVFQVSDAGPGKWNLTLNNAKNVQDAIGKENVDIEIVAFGPRRSIYEEMARHVISERGEKGK